MVRRDEHEQLNTTGGTSESKVRRLITSSVGSGLSGPYLSLTLTLSHRSCRNDRHDTVTTTPFPLSPIGAAIMLGAAQHTPCSRSRVADGLSDADYHIDYALRAQTTTQASRARITVKINHKPCRCACV